ncbi:putative Protein kinase domain-containing protein [Seiridium cardinale]|uniref:Protein kinase domain-containing protein n=1 Tax=Seiridium cardinale TaxID=138064 RepID=A0ABR2XF46_9PEZI
MSSGRMSSRAEAAARILKKCFDADARYYLEDYVGSGFQADVFRIRKTSQTVTGPELAAVKIPASSSAVLFGGILDFMSEQAALEALIGAAHVVQPLHFSPTDPLEPGASELPAHEWMYMEWLENGTLKTFLTRASRANIALPNRVMWRIFLCYVRMCVALAWPDAHDPNNIQLEALRNDVPTHAIENTDPNSGNMVFGSFVPDPSHVEHGIMPIMKMIDLGFVKRRETPDLWIWRSTVKGFIGRIGTEMSKIINVGRPGITNADVDPNMQQLVTACQASETASRPGIHDLAPAVADAVQNRDAAWYRQNVPGQDSSKEEDDTIIALVRSLFLDAPAAPPAPTGFAPNTARAAS